MKIKFLENCHDKYNGTDYKQGDVLEFEDDRALEIIQTGYATAIENDVEEVQENIGEVQEEIEEHNPPIKLSELKRDELIQLAKEYGVSYRGSKDDIIKRLLDKQNELE